MSIQLLILVYAYVCTCVVLFDLLFSGYTAHNSRREPVRKQRLWEEISLQLEGQRSADKAFLKRLSNVQYLIVLSRLAEENPAEMKLWAERNLPFLLKLCRVYNKKPNAQKAFFSYMLSRLDLNRDEIKVPAADALRGLEEMLADMMLETSVHVRENALKALLCFGSPDTVCNAVLCINQTPEYQNEKLLSDHLLAYRGDQGRLAALLWESFTQLTAVLQVSFVNYLRRLPQGAVEHAPYCAPLCAVLRDDGADKELRLALLRYFRGRAYLPAEEEMLRMVENAEEAHWEYAAVAASCLTDCLKERAKAALLKAMKSPNWYLRLNAVENLLQMDVALDPAEIQRDDRYAGDMLYYRMQLHEMKE